MAPVMQELPLMCLMLLLLCRDWGVGAKMDQHFKLQQPQDKVLVTAGETLTLNCTMSGLAYPGPVRWLKGLGSGNKTVYDQSGDSLPRVERAVFGSHTDFTIHIKDIQPEDMGTYYCMKFVKTVTGMEEVFQRGSGTEVSVQGANLLSSFVLLWVCILLEKGFLGGLLFFLFKRMKRRLQGLLPYPAPSQSLPPRAGSQGLATASSVM